MNATSPTFPGIPFNFNTFPGLAADGNPSLTIFKTNLCLAYTGEGDQVYVVSFQGTWPPMSSPGMPGWGSPLYNYPVSNIDTTPETLSAIVGSKNELYLFWTGASNKIYWTMSSNPSDNTSWMDPQVLKLNDNSVPATNFAPTAINGDAIYGPNSIILFWTGTDTKIRWAYYVPGQGWSDPFIPQDSRGDYFESNDSPAAVANSNAKGNSIQLVWNGAKSRTVWYSTYTESVETSNPVGQPTSEVWGWMIQQEIFDIQTNRAPALVCDGNNEVWLTFLDTTNQLWFSQRIGEGVWSPKTLRYGIPSCICNALVSTGNDSTYIMMAWLNDNDSAIYYGPLRQPPKEYLIALNKVQCVRARCPSGDWDWGCISVQVSTSTSSEPSTTFFLVNRLFKNNTNLDEGLEGMGCTDDIYVPDNAQILMAYMIINWLPTNPFSYASPLSGIPGKYIKSVTEKLVNAGAAAAQSLTDSNAIGAAIGKAIGTGAVPIGVFGKLDVSALGVLSRWLTDPTQQGGITFPNCDGPVACAVKLFTSAQLLAAAQTFEESGFTSSPLVLQIDNHAATGTQPGCCNDPLYQVTWSVILP
jgi:hypothetical protein